MSRCPTRARTGRKQLVSVRPPRPGRHPGTVSVFSMKRGLVVLATRRCARCMRLVGIVLVIVIRRRPRRRRRPGHGARCSSTATASSSRRLPYLQSTDQIRAFGGTALCDWVDKMARAATVEQPSVMVVEFVGNDVTPCMQGYQTPDQVRAKYEADMARLKRLVDAPILWVGPPGLPRPGSRRPRSLLVGAAVRRRRRRGARRRRLHRHAPVPRRRRVECRAASTGGSGCARPTGSTSRRQDRAIRPADAASPTRSTPRSAELG